jgi:acyl-CoA synthetase (AMP-forming)/AMP-acid ligase II
MTRLWDEISNAITCVITPVRWSAEIGLNLLERERVTVGQGVPTQWDLMLRHPRFEECDFSAMRIAAIGAASIPAELVRQVRRRFDCPVVVRYTSTEACITTSTSPEDPVEVVALTVGKPVAGVELELVDHSGRPVAAGQVGQIRCRSGAVMKGYWRDAERTAQVLDADGWLTTGDLAYVDDDGNLRITGRLQDMYIRGGYNVYPVQVEDALLSHPKVDDVAVLGVPDPVLGEIGMAFVVSGARPAPTLDELKQWTRTSLADYKAPDKLKVVDEIPRNAMGKIDRRALAAQLEQSPAVEPVPR